MSEEQIQRYSRHILLPGVGGVGQERLLASSVLIAYSEDEESAALMALAYLAAAGVGQIGWCPLDEDDGIKQKSPLSAFYGGSLGSGLKRLNPDSRLTPYHPGEGAKEVFDVLAWLGDESAGDLEAFMGSGKFLIRGVSRDEAGEISEYPGAFAKPDVTPHGGGASTVAAQGALGAWLAARILRHLVDETDSVGSTAQARFDFSHGFIEAHANLS
ncbi:MAG: hypothetical protein OXG62_11045 [Nitrospinae bacterium]|nr:hypothetical protein [Nitrospinota bacterium]